MKSACRTFLAVAVASGFLLGSAIPAAAQNEIDDVQLKSQVRSELGYDPVVKNVNVVVTVDDGQVTLSGRVDTLKKKSRAERIVRSVRGVQDVVNAIEVDTRQTWSDSDIKGDVSDALFENPATDSYEVEAEVDDGRVTLTGTVDSYAEKILAENVVMGVHGVRSVKNEIRVEFDAERPPIEIEEDIEQMLQRNPAVLADDIEVDVDGNEAILSGTVSSLTAKDEAVLSAYVTGVNNVDSRGLIVWDGTTTREKKTEETEDEYEWDDTRIKQSINRALLWEPEVLSINVNVDVTNGFVTLTGQVETLKAMREAEALAEDTPGVEAVTNNLVVEYEDERTDVDIAVDVRNALARNSEVDSFDLSVSVTEGIATLNGAVDSYYEKIEAEEVTSSVPGVTAVLNDLTVADAEYPNYDPYVDPYDFTVYEWYTDPEPVENASGMTDREMLDSIQDELWWSPFVDSTEVAVTVNDGVATLTGTVDSYSEEQSAVENAREGGAVAVVNQLEVDVR